MSAHKINFGMEKMSYTNTNHKFVFVYHKHKKSFGIAPVDNHLYVVVHSSSTYVSLDDLQMNFVCKFVLGDVNNCMYIIKVGDIVCPLFVFKNYGGEGKMAKDLFCTLPQPNWGKYFGNEIASHIT